MAANYLATALERAGRTDEALQVLIACEEELARQSDLDFVTYGNLHARLHLAQLYRKTGHEAKAISVENALRAQLKLADADHVIARTVNRQPSGSTRTSATAR